MRSSRLGPYARDVLDLDAKHQLEHLHETSIQNIAFFTLALGGEVGELQNLVKKLWREGPSQELYEAILEESVDVLIYFVELVNILPGDFDQAWDAKHEVLKKRFQEKFPNGYKLQEL